MVGAEVVGAQGAKEGKVLEVKALGAEDRKAADRKPKVSHFKIINDKFVIAHQKKIRGFRITSLTYPCYLT